MRILLGRKEFEYRTEHDDYDDNFEVDEAEVQFGRIILLKDELKELRQAYRTIDIPTACLILSNWLDTVDHPYTQYRYVIDWLQDAIAGMVEGFQKIESLKNPLDQINRN